MDCAVISNGIVKAAKTMDLKIPVVARLEGEFGLFQILHSFNSLHFASL